MKTIDLSGKTALVTGASSGIGQAIAIELARCGAAIIVNYRHNEAGAHETLTQIEHIGGTGRIVQADVSAGTGRCRAVWRNHGARYSGQQRRRIGQARKNRHNGRRALGGGHGDQRDQHLFVLPRGDPANERTRLGTHREYVLDSGARRRRFRIGGVCDLEGGGTGFHKRTRQRTRAGKDHGQLYCAGIDHNGLSRHVLHARNASNDGQKHAARPRGSIIRSGRSGCIPGLGHGILYHGRND